MTASFQGALGKLDGRERLKLIQNGNQVDVSVADLASALAVQALPALGLRPSYAGPSALANTRRWLSLLRTSSALRNMRMLFVGDSKTMGAGGGTANASNGSVLTVGAFARARPARVAARLAAAGLTVYQGFVGFNGLATPADKTAYDPRLTLTNATGGSRSLAGVITSASAGTYISYQQDTRVYDRFSVLAQFDSARPAFQLGKGAESFTFTPNLGAPAFQRVDAAFATKDAAPFTVSKGSTGSVPIALGVAWDSANLGVEIMNAGTYGITAANTAAPQNNNGTDFLPALRTYAPDLTVINLGTNDLSSSGLGFDPWIAAVTAIAAAAKESGDVIVCWPSIATLPPQYGSDATRAAWRDALLSLAVANVYGFMDEEVSVNGRYDAIATSATADGVHEVPWPYDLQAANIVSAILA